MSRNSYWRNNSNSLMKKNSWKTLNLSNSNMNNCNYYLMNSYRMRKNSWSYRMRNYMNNSTMN